MSRRAVACALGLAAVLALSGSVVASAKFRGTDLWGNIMPPDGSGLASRYPLSAYMLDYHVSSAVSLSGVSSDNAGDAIAQFFSKWLFFVGVLFVRVVVAVFQWGVNVNFVTGPHGVLNVTSGISRRYYDDFVKPFMVSFVILFGAWLAYKTLKTHERSDAGSSLARVLVFAVISMALINYPQQTLGRAYDMVDGISSAIVARGGEAQSATDAVWKALVYRPWVTLEFGGLRHCVNPNKTDADGFPLAAGPGRTLCRDNVTRDATGHGGYAQLFLEHPDERTMLYNSIRDGKLENSCADTICRTINPSAPQLPVGWKVDKADAPAVDMMQGEGSVQRLVFTIGFVLCMIFGALLMALVAVAALFAQVALVALSIFVAFTVLAALYPPLHRQYKHFLSLTGQVLVSKIVFALLLAIPLSTSAAMVSIASQGGYAIALVVQTLIFGGVFIKRRALIAAATSSRTAKRYTEHENQVVSAVAGAASASLGAVSGGAGTFAHTMREGWSAHREQDGDAPPPDSSSPPASAGREYSPPGDPASLPETSDADQMRRWSGAGQSAPAESMNGDSEGVNMRSFRDDLQAERAQREGHSGAYAASDADGHEPEREPLYVGGEPSRDGQPTPVYDDLQRERCRRPSDQYERERDLELDR